MDILRVLYSTVYACAMTCLISTLNIQVRLILVAEILTHRCTHFNIRNIVLVRTLPKLLHLFFGDRNNSFCFAPSVSIVSIEIVEMK